MSGPLNYALEHLHWPFLVAACWWVRGKVEEFLGKVDGTHKQVTNDLPHQLTEQTVLLTSMDKNIAVMAARRE